MFLRDGPHEIREEFLVGCGAHVFDNGAPHDFVELCELDGRAFEFLADLLGVSIALLGVGPFDKYGVLHM